MPEGFRRRLLPIYILTTMTAALAASAQQPGRITETEIKPIRLAATKSKAAGTSADSAETDDSIGDLIAEPAPQPEAPYPGSDKSSYSADPSLAKPKPKPNSTPRSRMGVTEKRSLESHPESTEPVEIQRPKAINEDGDYIYDTSTKPTEYSGRPGVTEPRAIAPDGEFQYDNSAKSTTFSGRKGIEAPTSTSSNGEFRYKLPTHPSTKAAVFRVGVMTAPKITNSNNNKTWGDVYGNSPAPLLLLQYQLYRPHWWTAGRIALMVGSGVFAASGQGYFKDPTRTDIPDERFTFLMFPNTLSLNYKFQFSDRQVFAPYVEGGVGYYTFVEVRDDAKNTKFGGSPTLFVAGGLNFLMDSLDMHAIRELDDEYGINHLWLSLEVRQVVGLEQSTNFTSNIGTLGFIMEF